MIVPVGCIFEARSMDEEDEWDKGGEREEIM
jgi:hypothetical protein